MLVILSVFPIFTAAFEVTRLCCCCFFFSTSPNPKREAAMSLQPLSRQTKGNEWFHILWTEPSLSTAYREGEEGKRH